jgi:hypothetical protein
MIHFLLWLFALFINAVVWCVLEYALNKRSPRFREWVASVTYGMTCVWILYWFYPA